MAGGDNGEGACRRVSVEAVCRHLPGRHSAGLKPALIDLRDRIGKRKQDFSTTRLRQGFHLRPAIAVLPPTPYRGYGGHDGGQANNLNRANKK